MNEYTLKFQNNLKKDIIIIIKKFLYEVWISEVDSKDISFEEFSHKYLKNLY